MADNRSLGKKALIFGASGFVGRYLAQELADNGYSVYGADIKDSDSASSLLAFYPVDILDYEAVERVISEVAPDVLINLAAISSVGESWSIPQTTIRINVIGTLNILEVIRKHFPDTRLLLVGSSEEYVISNYPMSEERPLDATNPYGISKATQEQFAKMYREQYGLKVYCARSFNHTGIGQRESFVLPSWCKQIAEIDRSGSTSCIKVGNRSVNRDLSHVRDVVRAYRLIVESDDCSLVYNVGSGKAYSLNELLEYICGLSKQRVSIQVDQGLIRPTDQPVICCDNNLIRSLLGWEPEYTVFDALGELYSYYRG